MRSVEEKPRHAGTRPAAGFTLLEIIVALAVVGILAGVAMSNFHGSVMRTRRTEAILGLAAIYHSQQIHYQSEHSYGDTFDEIGFVLEGGRQIDERTIQGSRYTFTLRALPSGDDPRGNFQALASGNLDSDEVLDILMIENQLTVDR